MFSGYEFKENPRAKTRVRPSEVEAAINTTNLNRVTIPRIRGIATRLTCPAVVYVSGVFGSGRGLRPATQREPCPDGVPGIEKCQKTYQKLTVTSKCTLEVWALSVVDTQILGDFGVAIPDVTNILSRLVCVLARDRGCHINHAVSLGRGGCAR